MAEQEESYSLWLCPPADAPVTAKLQRELQTLAEAHGGPVFPPHVTLLGDIRRPRDEVVAIAQSLAEQTKPYRINFLNATRGTFYYQCVFLLAAQDPAVMATAQLARQLYGMQHKPHTPHLSLLYADMDDAAKDKVAAGSRARLFGEGSTYATLLTDPGFTAAGVQVWYTPTADRSLGSWCKVGEVAFSG